MMNAARRKREKEVRAENILDAAEQVFFGKGFARTSMEEIALHAGASRALLYVYFKDKAAIMRGIMLRAAQALLLRLQAAFAAGDSGLAQLEGFGWAYYRFSLEQSDYFDVLTNLNTFPLPDEPCPLFEEVRKCSEQLNLLLVTALENGIQDGSLCRQRVADPVLTANFLEGALHGVIMQTRSASIDECQYPDDATLIRYTIGMLLHSLRN
ncbi:MAG: TetR/AcrR family transcriptional regulator [Pseudomonadales bacterium]|nr:TetR/AcrR family transcriptional regulator [Pseudomonadales bacterium]